MSRFPDVSHLFAKEPGLSLLVGSTKSGKGTWSCLALAQASRTAEHVLYAGESKEKMIDIFQAAEGNLMRGLFAEDGKEPAKMVRRLKGSYPGMTLVIDVPLYMFYSGISDLPRVIEELKSAILDVGTFSVLITVQKAKMPPSLEGLDALDVVQAYPAELADNVWVTERTADRSLLLTCLKMREEAQPSPILLSHDQVCQLHGT